MPIPLGVLAVAGAGGGAGAGAAYELLESVILTGNQSTITFSNLNSTYGSTYQHLQLRIVSRSNFGSAFEEVTVLLNGDSNTNYSFHYIVGTGSSVISSNGPNEARMFAFYGASGGGATANAFGAVIVDILDSFETTKHKTIRTLGGRAIGSNEDRVALGSGAWRNTAAITTITLNREFGSNFVSGSRFSLYGLRSA